MTEKSTRMKPRQSRCLRQVAMAKFYRSQLDPRLQPTEVDVRTSRRLRHEGEAYLDPVYGVSMNKDESDFQFPGTSRVSVDHPIGPGMYSLLTSQDQSALSWFTLSIAPRVPRFEVENIMVGSPKQSMGLPYLPIRPGVLWGVNGAAYIPVPWSFRGRTCSPNNRPPRRSFARIPTSGEKEENSVPSRRLHTQHSPRLHFCLEVP